MLAPSAAVVPEKSRPTCSKGLLKIADSQRMLSKYKSSISVGLILNPLDNSDGAERAGYKKRELAGAATRMASLKAALQYGS